MDKEIKTYRQKHQKCKGCKYYKYESPSTKIMGLECPDYEMCILKDKIIHFTNGNHLCKHYKIREENNEY